VRDAESVFFPGTTHMMGFELRNQNLQILLDKNLAPFVRRAIVPLIDKFLSHRELSRADVTRFILHPGGRRVIEAMAEKLEREGKL
jgi:alkylresorcinol/alkylpyrone synthase